MVKKNIKFISICCCLLFILAFLSSCSSYKVTGIYGYEGMLGMKVFEDITTNEGLSSEEYTNETAPKTKEFTVNEKVFSLSYSHSIRLGDVQNVDVYLESDNSDENAVEVRYTANTDYIEYANFPRAEFFSDTATEEELRSFVDTFLKDRTQFSLEHSDWEHVSYTPPSNYASTLLVLYNRVSNGIRDAQYAAEVFVSRDEITISASGILSDSPLSLEKVTEDFKKELKNHGADEKCYAVEYATQFTANGKIYVRLSVLQGVSDLSQGNVATEGIAFMMVYTQ